MHEEEIGGQKYEAGICCNSLPTADSRLPKNALIKI